MPKDLPEEVCFNGGFDFNSYSKEKELSKNQEDLEKNCTKIGKKLLESNESMEYFLYKYYNEEDSKDFDDVRLAVIDNKLLLEKDSIEIKNDIIPPSDVFQYHGFSFRVKDYWDLEDELFLRRKDPEYYFFDDTLISKNKNSMTYELVNESKSIVVRLILKLNNKGQIIDIDVKRLS